MNRIMTPLFIAGMSLIVWACSDKKPTESTGTEQTTETVNTENSETTKANASTNQAQAILSAYLKIKDALVDTNGSAANDATSTLLATVKNADGNDLLLKIQTNAESILLSNDPESQRKDFKILSQNVYELVKNAASNETPIYKQFCPMAFGNTGAFWLSTEEEINNPYFGDKMLHCGRVDEKL